MSQKEFKPYVPATSSMAELTLKAVLLGTLMALILGAANAFVGMKAGLTVAATFPAAVVAMAVLRLFRGNILEENLARTTASVGEALVAGAIFTLPAFVITGAWEELRYLPSTLIMLIGGVLGVLFVIVLRRTLVVESDLAFPESVATAEIVKAGQGGQTGAGYLFGGLGLAALGELFKNSNGLRLFADSASGFIRFGESTIQILKDKIGYAGGMLVQSPSASPMLFGVGYIVGTRVSAVLFAGAVMGWLFLIPLAIFLNPGITATLGPDNSMADLANEVWSKQIRPLAVGTMIVAAFYTLYNLRTSLIAGIGKAFHKSRATTTTTTAAGADAARTEKDLDFRKVFAAIAVLAVPMFVLYWRFARSLGGAVVLTVVMLVLGFLFAAVAGYLVGLIGSSNNPISGLTLSTLLIAALLMIWIGVVGLSGVAAVLAIAGVICCAAGVAGDMMQDLKVGHILGGTPWRMEVSEIIGVIAAAAFLALPMQVMIRVYGLGSAELPAPQAGLMALLAQGIVGGEMAWPLVIVGMLLAFGLILIGAPSPMLIAVGMYLPFSSTSAIFVGGLIRWFMDVLLARRKASADEMQRAGNVGVLISSGFIAGESLMGVTMAVLVIAREWPPLAWAKVPALLDSPPAWPGLIILAVCVYMLAYSPLKAMKRGGLPSTHVE